MIANAFWKRVLRICRRMMATRQLALPAPKTTTEGDPDMPSARVNKMIIAGRRHLLGHPAMLADDYAVKRVMAAVVTDHTAVEQMEAIGKLRIEFAARAQPAPQEAK